VRGRRRISRWVAGAGVCAVVVGVATLWGGTSRAGAATPVFTFSQIQSHVQMTIPGPACPESNACEWMLYVNEPFVAGGPTVAEVTGTSGTLTVPYPPNFCGVLQADALIGPGKWVYLTGIRQTVGLCSPTVVDTSSAVAGQPSTLPYSAPASTAPAPVATSAKTLPFTGVDVGPEVVLGTVLLLAGMVLLVDSDLRRLRWIGAVGPIRWVGAVLAWLMGG
jgi:hypothetical protein